MKKLLFILGLIIFLSFLVTSDILNGRVCFTEMCLRADSTGLHLTKTATVGTGSGTTTTVGNGLDEPPQ